MCPPSRTNGGGHTLLRLRGQFGRLEKKPGTLSTLCYVQKKHKIRQPNEFLCPFAVYYLRYAVRSFFTMSRISLAEGKRAVQKVQRKIAVAVQKVKSPLLFVPLF